MIRVVLFLIMVGALSLGFAWLADRPGEVVITWQGLRIETSLIVLGAALLIAMAAIALFWSILRAILFSPRALRRHLHRRRGERAYEAISHGLIAVGSGDIAASRKHTADAKRFAPTEPLTLFLHAQAAQLGGDRDAADGAFRAMASRADTKALGLRGLHIEAQRRGDLASAHAFAEEAARDNPSLGWAGKAALEFRCLTGDWAGALALLEAQKPTLGKEAYRRQRAVLLTARALALEDSDRDSAKAFAREAHKLAPTLVPAAALAGRLLAEGGELRKASRIIDSAWRANPHPELAQAHAELRSGEAARDRLKRIEALAKRAPGHIEGALAVARAAIDAQEFAKARATLAPYLATPTKRIAQLMAELERAERNDEGRAREWLARDHALDPVWTADGYISKQWRPVSPAGRLDAWEWRVPVAGMVNAPVIEAQRPAAAPIELARGESANATPPPAVAEILPSRRRGEPTQPKPEPVIPLIHVPDDPGPDMVEGSEAPAEGESAGWRKLFG